MINFYYSFINLLLNFYCFLNRIFNNIFIFNSIYVLDNKLNKKNKTFEFYISYFTNFYILNKKYYKICIKNNIGVYKIFTDLDYKTVYNEYKKLKICVLNKRFIKFKINDIDCLNNIKDYCFYSNSILDYYLFNHSILNTIDNPYDVLNYLDNLKVEYKLMDLSKHKISEIKTTDNLTLIINELE